MKIVKYFLPAVIFIFITGCGEGEIERQKEKLGKDANELKMKIDTVQSNIDTAIKNIDSLAKKYSIDSLRKDSTIKKIFPIK